MSTYVGNEPPEKVSAFTPAETIAFSLWHMSESGSWDRATLLRVTENIMPLVRQMQAEIERLEFERKAAAEECQISEEQIERQRIERKNRLTKLYHAACGDQDAYRITLKIVEAIHEIDPTWVPGPVDPPRPADGRRREF